MGQQVRGFPKFPKHNQTVKFANRRYRITFTWRDRALAWYFDLYSADGVALVLGRRMSPQWPPIAGIGFAVGVAPDGHLYVRGTDGYQRDALGDTLILTRYDAAELPAPATADALVVTGGV